MKKGWKVERLGNVCDIYNGGTPDTKVAKYWGGDILWITPKDMGQLEDIYVDDTSRKITKEGLKNSSAKALPPNSVILSSRAPIGHLAINTKEITTNQGCRGIVPHKELLSLYLYYFLKNSVDLLNSLGSGTTFKELSAGKLAEVEIPIPPLPEQQRIVALLDETFAALTKVHANAERNQVNAREVFESAQREIFGNGNHNKTETKMLGDIASFRNGINFTKSSKGETLKIVGVKDFQNNFWVPSENLDSVRIDGKLNETDYLQKGDILAVRSNGNQQLIGRTILASDVTEKTTHSGFTIRIRFESKDIFPEYLCHYLKSDKARKQMISGGAGISIKSLNQQTLTNLPIPLPPLAEQRAIVGRLDALAKESRRLEQVYQQKVEAVEELRKSVLQKAFGGEL